MFQMGCQKLSAISTLYSHLHLIKASASILIVAISQCLQVDLSSCQCLRRQPRRPLSFFKSWKLKFSRRFKMLFPSNLSSRKLLSLRLSILSKFKNCFKCSKELARCSGILKFRLIWSVKTRSPSKQCRTQSLFYRKHLVICQAPRS